MTHFLRAKRAFTLMEMILAMAMVAMLAGGMYMSLTIAFKARDIANAAVTPMRSAAITMDLIRQDFESVPPAGPAEDPLVPPTLSGPFYGTAQSGGRDGALLSTVQFHTISRDHLPADVVNPLAEGIRGIELGVRSEGGTSVLVRRVTRNLLAPSLSQPQEEILCRGVRSFTLRYYDGSAWHEEWDSTLLGDALPFAVEVTLEIDKPASQTSSPWFTDAQANAYRVVRVFPLPCAKPVDASQAGGIMQ
jgi:prepilin-type N-terminal cleavage/methylation domain-containing protein